jgi:hypothetical protein
MEANKNVVSRGRNVAHLFLMLLFGDDFQIFKFVTYNQEVFYLLLIYFTFGAWFLEGWVGES